MKGDHKETLNEYIERKWLQGHLQIDANQGEITTETCHFYKEI